MVNGGLVTSNLKTQKSRKYGFTAKYFEGVDTASTQAPKSAQQAELQEVGKWHVKGISICLLIT